MRHGGSHELVPVPQSRRRCLTVRRLMRAVSCLVVACGRFMWSFQERPSLEGARPQR